MESKYRTMILNKLTIFLNEKIITHPDQSKKKTISYEVCYWRNRAQIRLVKFVGDDTAGRTPYTFYKPNLGQKDVSNRPYNEFITPTTFIYPIMCVFNGFPLPIFYARYTLDWRYAVTWRQCCDTIGWSYFEVWE